MYVFYVTLGRYTWNLMDNSLITNHKKIKPSTLRVTTKIIRCVHDDAVILLKRNPQFQVQHSSLSPRGNLFHSQYAHKTSILDKTLRH